MKSSRNSFGMMFLSRFIILQSVVTRYLFVQKVVNCCIYYQQNGIVKGNSTEVKEFNSIMEFLYLGRKANKDLM